MTHVLACALCSNNPTSAPTSPGTVIAYLAIAAVAVVVLIVNAKRKQARRPPLRGPMTSISPGARSLLSGRNITAYWAPVNAVTPSGIPVRASRCCLPGHQLPEQAAAHAAQIAGRIAVHGR